MIYMDHAATTPVDVNTLGAMTPYFLSKWGNPSSLYGFGREARVAVEEARRRVATSFNCNENEVFFTSGGTESDNWAIKGVAFANMGRGKHIITTTIEHHAVLRSCQWLETLGFEVTYLEPDKTGFIHSDSLRKAIRKDTILVSVMLVNNEIGTMQDIKVLADVAHEYGAYMHTDAVQAYGHVDTDVEALCVDLMSISGHKVGAPKGIGALYIKTGTIISPLLHGGEQEMGYRAGTENVPYIVALGHRAKKAKQMVFDKSRRSAMRYFASSLQKEFPSCKLNGHPYIHVDNNVSVTFPGYNAEEIAEFLAMHDVCCSTGSACNASSNEPSHVLLAIGLSIEDANATLRFTVGDNTTKEDIDKVIRVLKDAIETMGG